MPTVRALGCLATLTLLGTNAAADGEQTPMIGGAFIGGESARSPDGIYGGELEAAWWLGRIGVAVEGSLRETASGHQDSAKVLGASARLRVFQSLVPSLIESRDVELGIELQAIVEHAWWDVDTGDRDALGYGLGAALRLRGGGDEDQSTLIAESRLFVRVISRRTHPGDLTPRTTMPSAVESTPNELLLLVGVGAAWGTGDHRYVDRFRWH
jgi:hypothetical protein